LFIAYLETGLVLRQPTAILTTGLMLLAWLSFVCGLVLDTVTRGRWEVKRLQYLWAVALPLGLRISIPAMLNTSISVLKNSSYMQVIGLAELTYVAMERSAMDFRTLENFAAICVLYLMLVWGLSFVVRRVEAQLHKPFRDGR